MRLTQVKRAMDPVIEKFDHTRQIKSVELTIHV